MRDMLGNPVEVGDFLLDERGRLHEVRESSATIQVQVIYTYEVRYSRGAFHRISEGFVRSGFCLKADGVLRMEPLDGRIATYQRLFQQYRQPQLRAEFAARRATIQAARESRLKEPMVSAGTP